MSSPDPSRRPGKEAMVPGDDIPDRRDGDEAIPDAIGAEADPEHTYISVEDFELGDISVEAAENFEDEEIAREEGFPRRSASRSTGFEVDIQGEYFQLLFCIQINSL